MKKRDIFDLEQSILACWNITDELKILNEALLEQDLDRDTTSNILLGLEQMYQLKFNKCFESFEEIVSDYWKYRKHYESTTNSTDEDTERNVDLPF